MARNKELNQKMRDERRSQILSNALKLFAVKGLTGTKISDISSSTEIAQGLIYHYFKSKEEIFTELIRYAFEKMNDACTWIEKHKVEPVEKIKIAINGLLNNLDKEEDNAHYYLLIAQATISDSTPKEAKKIIDKESNLPYKIMEKVIRKGQKDGTIKQYNAQDLSTVFWTSIKGLAFNKTQFGKKFKMPNPEILIKIFIKD